MQNLPNNLKSFPNSPSKDTKPIPKTKLDIATILGLILGFSLIVTAILMGGGASDFIDFPSILIVFGGTFAATTICFSMEEMKQAFTATMHTLFRSIKNPQISAIKAMQLAEIARAKGPLFLQTLNQQFNNERILYKGIELITDITSTEEVARVLYQESAAIEISQFQSAQVLQKASEFAPAMGLIGTLVGLIHMLGHLNDPAIIGPSMAVAILTTFYGAVLANLVFAPIASKLLKISQDDALINKIYTITILSMSRQENPRQLETQLNSILPPDKRIRYFNK
ncbi:MAG: MotA/TolQ/ExbB proton channel family protein [Alphaproteobacteria bacterium]|nr:MotA/TolQ/ExbB proton channel family protein [Alphaproteobacteria bacterium]